MLTEPLRDYVASLAEVMSCRLTNLNETHDTQRLENVRCRERAYSYQQMVLNPPLLITLRPHNHKSHNVLSVGRNMLVFYI